MRMEGVPDADLAFARLVIEQRLASPEQVDEGLSILRRMIESGVSPRPSLGEILAGKNFLPSRQAEQTLRAGDRAPTPEASGPDPEGERFGKYVRVSRLGSGGMGEVWKGWDTELRRWVALKFLKVRDFEERARFRREAQTAAKLNHPNIGAVYEARDDFIAMQFIDGQTLSTFPRNDRRALVELVRDAARAVHAAHEQGVIHRDLKPENLMVEKNRVYVMDFGLAKSMAVEAGLSVSGTIVGTPSYMSPEQARGGALDHRTDVYSLGATLYELLSDRPPFRSPDVYGLLKKVIEDDASPLRAEPDLATITMKCLEKDPGRRYATAREFAEDLTRWLSGEAILAHPPSTLYRIRKYVARRKGVVVTAAAGVLLAVGLSAWLLPRLWKTQSRLTEAQQELVRQMRTLSDAYLELALVARRQDELPKMRSYAPQVEDVCRRVIREIPHLAEPHFRLGRMQRALMNDGAALAEQEEALRKEPDYAPARYERLILVARLYRDRVNELVEEGRRVSGDRMISTGGRYVPPPSPRELSAKDPEAARLLARLKEDLESLERSSGELSPAHVDCARGLLSWVTGDPESARESLQRALEKVPDLDEAVEALGMLEMEAGRYEKAVEWWSTGIERDRGHVVLREGRGRARAFWVLYRGKDVADPPALYAAAVEDYTEAIRREPSRTQNWTSRGGTRVNWGVFEESRGRDPTELYTRAIEDFDEAIRREPSFARTWAYRGNARANLGTYRGGLGESPSGAYASAIADYDEALRRNPGDFETWLNRAAARMNWATSLGGAADRMAAAIEDFNEALRRNPDSSAAWMSRGTARSNWAGYRAARGEDPAELCAAAIEDFREAIRRDPDNAAAWAWQANVRVIRGNHEQRLGKDPSKHYSAAVAEFDEALSRGPRRDESWTCRGNARMCWGSYEVQAGRDPKEFYGAAIRDFDEAISINARRDEPWMRRGMARQYWAVFEITQGRDPSEHCAAAVADLTQALRLNPARDETWLTRGDARMYWGFHQAATADPSELYAAAIADYQEALQRNPGRVVTWISRGGTLVNWGIDRRRRGQDPSDLYTSAIECFDEAVRLNEAYAEPLRHRGNAYFNRGNWKASRREEYASDFRAALDDWQMAISLDPKLEPQLRRGIDVCRRALGEK